MIPYRYSISFFMLGLLLAPVNPAEGEPYLAVREGRKCTSCHVNRAGLGKRTPFGVAFSQSALPIDRTQPSDSKTVLDRYINEFLSIGSDVRVVNNTTLPDVGGASRRNTFQFFEANIYTEVTLKKDRLKVYLDEQVAPDAANREIVGIIHGLPYNAYIKVGRMFLPYGFRLWDFDAFIRSQTPQLGSDVGVEFGVEPGSMSIQLAVTNGEQFRTSDSNNGKQITLRASTIHRRGRIGGSFSVNTQDPFAGGRDETRIMGGPFIGLSTGRRITLLGEYDLIRAYDMTTGDHQLRQVAYGEVDFLLSRGVNAKAAVDYFDPNNGQDTAKRLRIGLEPVINEFLQARVFYNLNRPRNFQDPLFNTNNPNQDYVSFELHFMF